jgi:2-methylcitrate dehydratase PrpD
MSVLASLSGFVQSELELTDADRDHLALHLLDTLGATLAGSRTKEGEALARLDRGGGTDSAILRRTASARATEMDDIHLASCTTPGSIVVPTALLLASADRLSSPHSLLSAVAVGYEVLVRVGLAIDGPNVLASGVWPTLFAAPLGAAAVAARAFGLTTEATAGALATALALSTGTPIRASSEPTSRWITVGAAARNGVLAARAAAEGIPGTIDLLEARGGQVAGVAVSGDVLLDELGRRFRFREVGLKPYPVARQALAAVEACRILAVDTKRPLEIGYIEEIEIAVPRAQKAILDGDERGGAPARRMESIVSVRYLAAVAILAPERLHDVVRSPPFTTPAIQELASRVRVVEASDLDRYYPGRWPARVEMRFRGERLVKEILSPPGDVDSGYSWDEALEKFRRALAPRMAAERIEALATRVRALDEATRWPVPEIEAALADG